MTNIVEIIPDNLPSWAEDAMQDGQLFNECLRRVAFYEDIIKQAKSYFEKSAQPYDAGCMILRKAPDDSGS